ncbi:MAG: tRNA (adenosine(37)-N6)-threonylcarbamoyltransferase complex transferase subunit TsaD [Ruminococcus sp.]|nr:tRNA (adenosine(37)-N6)-threonylcarbamoyltransferase complex transferase subunit TsaD [Ruminococcus sp.]
MKILGIESSCDETAAAVSLDGREILSNVVASQVDEHRLYGGVVPEIASRRHVENISQVVNESLKRADCELSEIDAVAVTYAPGLIGALLVGVSFAKGLAMAAKKPLVPVHHIAGHIAANYITHRELEPPFLCLVVSGGHTHIISVSDYTHFQLLGRTRDDAAGECFDKAARVLGYEYPGGKYIELAARSGNPKAYALPKPRVAGSELDFSFSGLKTAVINTVHNAEQKGEHINREDMAASFQSTVAEILVEHTLAAAREESSEKLVIAGGVSANTAIRESFERACEESGIKLYMPKLEYCGDNGAMIACQGYYDFLDGRRADESLNAVASLSLG